LGCLLNVPPAPKRPRSRYVRRGKPKRPYPSERIGRGIAVLVALDQLGLLTNGQMRDLLIDDGPNRNGRSRRPAYAQAG